MPSQGCILQKSQRSWWALSKIGGKKVFLKKWAKLFIRSWLSINLTPLCLTGLTRDHPCALLKNPFPNTPLPKDSQLHAYFIVKIHRESQTAIEDIADPHCLQFQNKT